MDVFGHSISKRYCSLLTSCRSGIDADAAAQVLAEDHPVTLQMKRMLIRGHPFTDSSLTLLAATTYAGDYIVELGLFFTQK